MIKLKIVSRYSNGREVYLPGQVIEVEDVHARWLQADAPGCFEVWTEPKKPQTRRVRKPPVDKAIKEPPEEK